MQSPASSAHPLRLLCWEGYEAESVTRRFESAYAAAVHGETLLSDSLAADRLLGSSGRDFDIININNAYVRDCLEPAGLIAALDTDRFAKYRESIHPVYRRMLPWSYSANGDLIGIGQRFGPFNLVINSDAVSEQTARDAGFNLADDPANHGRYGILDYPDFNLFHIAIAAGIDPFQPLGEVELRQFETTANQWFRHAAHVSDDHHALNRMLYDGDIRFYLSGGIYTASPARLAGHSNIVAVTPRRGPIDGKGGIVFSEITSVIRNPEADPRAESFLQFMLEPETAVQIAFIEGTCNPVAQMGDRKVFDAFTRAQLDAIQWDTLEDDLQHCADYQIPPDKPALLRILESACLRYTHSEKQTDA